MNAENSKGTNKLPKVRFYIDSSETGLKAGFYPESPITGIDLIGLLGAGIWSLNMCVAEKFGIKPQEVWEMLKTTVDMVSEEVRQDKVNFVEPDKDES
jgi:hypothetical protein